MATATGLTIDDFERLPDDLARNHELDRWRTGRRVWQQPATQPVPGSSGVASGAMSGEHQLGIVISEQAYDFGGNAYGPDVSFISESKRPLLT
jgi:hypothetical protein